VEDSWEQLWIPAEPLEGPHQASTWHLTEILEEGKDVAANDELKALIKITSSSFPRQPGLGRTDPFDTLSAKEPMFDFLIQHSRSASSLIPIGSCSQLNVCLAL
jgi:hypothetical protein